jgi:hypothetical protein
MAIGRISGPLLKENLVRNGINIAFETDLLYLDVVNQRIGIKTVAPTHELQINGTTKTTTLIVDNRADIADVNIEGNTISTDQQYLRLGTFDNIIYNNKLRVDSIDIEGNVISTNSSNANLELRPNGTGEVHVYANMNVTGNIHATGNISADGTVTIGDADTDNVVFNAEVASDIIPDVNVTYDLGTTSKRWQDVYVNNLVASTINSTDLSVAGIDLVLRQGNIYYVAENGNNASPGDHPQAPFASVKHALSVATTGDTVHIYPGVYTEIFPLTIPVGVTVKGQGLRSVKIVPTVGTQFNDAFLLNGETTVEDITIADFYSSSTAEITLSSVINNPTPFGTSLNDFFGYPVAVSGNYVIVGALQEDDAGGTESGKAYIFNATTGALVHTLNNPNAYSTSGADTFGGAVAISNNYAIVGANAEDDAGGGGSGKAYIFNVATGALVHTLNNPNAYSTSAGDGFGFSVSISDNFAIVGAYAEDQIGGADSGKAYIFNVTTGALVHTLDNPNAYSTSASDAFGIAVGISGNYAIVTAWLEDDANGGNSGKAYIYNVTTGALLFTLNNPNPFSSSAGDLFGRNVAISGNYAIVGAYQEDDAGGTGGDSGKAYIFNVTTGALVHTLNNPNAFGTSASDFFGWSVAISGNYAIVGAYGEDDAGGGGSGKAYIFSTISGQLIQTINNPNAFGTSAGDFFAASVAISGNYAVVSAYLEDDAGGTESGKTYIYNLTGAVETGFAFKYAPGFTVTSRSPYIKNISVITKGSVTTLEDPRGFNAGNAGRGAYLDGAVANILSNEAACLFHSCTFITPGVDAIVMTNGVRVEWLNSFTYFANRGLYAVDGVSGLKGQGETAIRVDGLAGSITTGQTISYYDSDGVTLLGSAAIASIDGTGKIFIDGKQLGFETAAERGGKTIAANGDAKLSTAVKKFGTSSLALDGTGDYASIQSTIDFGFGTGDFTIDGWFYKTASLSQILIDTRTTSTQNSIMVQSNSANNLRLFVNGVFVLTSSNTHTLNAWNHLAISRVSGVTRFFINGVVSTNTYVDTTDYGTTKPLVLGASFVGLTSFSGYIDDLRIIKGVGLYTTTFTAPTTRALVTADTVLMARFDGANNSTTFEDDVVYAQDIRFSGGATAQYITLTDFTDFGAEVRLIGSASVYGNFGLVGDGPGVLMYAIGQNLAYIGNGKEVTNDPITVIQDNEVVETNGAKIRYNSVDHKGDFRVGDLFYVNQDTGTVELTVSNFNVSESGVTFTDGSNITFIDGTRIDTGNLRISGNTVESLSGNVNIVAASNEINLNNNVTITGNLDVTGNVSIGGNITIGDAPTDTIQFIAGIDSDIIPAQDSVYSLGTAALRWSNIFVNNVTVDNISISNNYITTTVSNTDLELRANGTGVILVPNNNVLINNELTVIGESTLGDVDVTGILTVNGNTTQTGNYDIIGDVTINGSLSIAEYAQFEEIRIDNNFITTTTSNTDLELRANGTGVILVPNNNVQITNDLTVVADINANNLTTTGTITANQFSTGNILIDNNIITTTLSNSDLELRANGTGNVVMPTNDVVLGQDLTVNGDTDLDDTTIQGTLVHTGNVTQVGNISLTGDYSISGTVTISASAQFENIQINNNVITTTDSNSDLELRAAGTGEVIVPNNDVVISNDLFVDGTITVGDINSAGTITANRFSTGDILIDDNFIITTTPNSDLELRANGTGEVVVPSNNVIIEQNLTVNGNTDLEDITIIGTITHTGAVTQTGNINITGNFATTGTVTVSASAQFENIQISGNVITTTDSNSNLELRANGTGIISIPNNDVVISNDLTVIGTITTGNITSTGTITANNFTTGDILIDDNFITTTTSNSNLELRANGTGSIVIDDFSINNATISSVSNFTIAPAGGSVIIDSTGAIKLPAGTILQRPAAVAGQIRFNSELARFEGYNGTNWIQLHGVVDVDGDTKVTAELTEGANDNTIRFIVQNNTIVDINTIRLNAPQVVVDAIQVDGNVISTITPNTDLVLSANGTGRVRFENFAFQDNRITNTVSGSNTILQTTGTGYFEFTDPYGVVLPVGDNSTRPSGVTGMVRYNTSDKRVELYDGTTWVSVAGASGGISFADAEGIAIEKVLIFG